MLREWENPEGDLVEFFHKVKKVHTTIGPKKDGGKEEVIFFHGKVANLHWDPDQLWWINEGQFLNYTTKIGRDSIINKNPRTTHVVDK